MTSMDAEGELKRATVSGSRGLEQRARRRAGRRGRDTQRGLEPSAAYQRPASTKRAAGDHPQEGQRRTHATGAAATSRAPPPPNAPSRMSPWMSTTFDAHRCADGVRPAASPLTSPSSCPGAGARSKTRRDSSFLILQVRGDGGGGGGCAKGGERAQPGATGRGRGSDHRDGRG